MEYLLCARPFIKGYMHIFSFSLIIIALHVNDTISNIQIRISFEPQTYLSLEGSQKYRIKFSKDWRKEIWGTFHID